MVRGGLWSGDPALVPSMGRGGRKLSTRLGMSLGGVLRVILGE